MADTSTAISDRKAERLKRGILTPALIVDQCLELLDSGGVNGFSLPKLGRALGADPTAVYRYFRSKDDLILAIADRLFEEALEDFSPRECWVDTVAEMTRRLRDVYRRHPAAASLTSYRTTQRPREMQAAEWLVGAMKAAGFEGAEAGLMYRAAAEFALNMAGGEANYLSLDVPAREADASAWPRAYRAVEREEYPNIWSVRDSLSHVSDDAVYERALEVFLVGLQALASVPCTCPAGSHSAASSGRR